MKRGGPLKRKTPLRAKTPLKRSKISESSKGMRAGRRIERDELPSDEWHDAILRRARDRCQVDGPDCTGKATEAHHRYRPGRPNTMANGVAVCSSCHTGSAYSIHRAVAWAYEVGLLIHAADGPPTQPWGEDFSV